MLLISCLYCGARDETEFRYGGQAHVPYPENPDELDDRQWSEFLFYRDNPKGIFAERWLHRTGCRQWFNVLRDTVTYEIRAVYPIGSPRPDPALYSPPGSNTGPTHSDTAAAGLSARCTATAGQEAIPTASEGAIE